MAGNFNRSNFDNTRKYNVRGTGFAPNLTPNLQYPRAHRPVNTTSPNRISRFPFQFRGDTLPFHQNSYNRQLDCNNILQSNEFNSNNISMNYSPPYSNVSNNYQSRGCQLVPSAVNNIRLQPPTFYKSVPDNSSYNTTLITRIDPVNAPNSSFSSQNSCTTKSNDESNNFNEKVSAYVNNVTTPPPRPKSYEAEVESFIERNSRFCKKPKIDGSSNVNKPRSVENISHSSESVNNSLLKFKPDRLKENISSESKSPEHGIVVKQERLTQLSIKQERCGSLSPERILAEFNKEIPGSWEYEPNLINMSVEILSRSSDGVPSNVNTALSAQEADRILDQFSKEVPCSWSPSFNSFNLKEGVDSVTTEKHCETNISEDLVNNSSASMIDTADSELVNHSKAVIDDSSFRSLSPSPERKYLHLVKISSRSPEREFLERINNRTTEKRSFHSQKRSISPPFRKARERSKSPQRYRSPCSIQGRRQSRSPSSSRSNSSRRSYTSRYHHSRYENSSLNRNSKSDFHSKTHRSSSSRRSYDRSDVSKISINEVGNKNEKHYTEREALLLKYTKDYCSDINEMRHKMNELSKLNIDELIKKETRIWTRMSPANLYYQPSETRNVLKGTDKLDNLCREFEEVLVKRADKIRASQPKYEPPSRKRRMKLSKHKSEISSCSSNDSGSDTSSTDEEDCTMEELERKRLHPYRLHQELWFNDAGEMNDGPLCRCSAKARRSGIRHNIYAGESNLQKCDINSNNADILYHYRITISPPTNFLIKTPTIISHDDHEFIFEGFSMFSHIRLDKLPVCKVIRFNIEYTILYFEEKMPENFTIKELDLFYEYLFKEILELVDLDFKAAGDVNRCAQFHFMPRFVRELPENGKEILSMNEVLLFLLKNCDALVKEEELENIQRMPQYEWQKQVDLIKGMIVTLPGMKPCALRVDQLDRDEVQGKVSLYPEIVHFGIRPPQLSYAGNPEYQKAWREYVKFRHLLANMPKPSFDDKRKLEIKEIKLQEMRTQSKMKRDVTVTVNSESFKKTGIMCDIVQHAMLIPVLVSHLRFHCSLVVLENTINYKFENRYLLQLALTHPSYRENFGTNPDHARNSLTNCGIRQPEYGDRRIHYMNTRKRGINTLINIMSRFGKRTETESNITHNERLEFLGDAVVEFITSIHLFHMFPELEEGGLATYRAAIVQNQHLAVLAKTLKLDEFMLYAHGSDLCHDLELRHAMANCFEALMGALFLDGGIKVADTVFGETLFKTESDLLEVWVNYPSHPLQEQEPLGDRKWIPRFELLKKLTQFEDSIGIEFTHVRLLARAFTDRSIGYTNLTLGSNQRLEFLGDTVLQLIASEYLYKFFPEHHEGHLSLLRSSLVNNRTQAVVCNDLGMTKYALYHNPKAELKTKDRADLLEAFLGALYVDKGLEYCEVFCNVCFFPRLQMFIMRQDWNDPKSKLQQCCLTLRTMEGGEPEIPIYKVIECMGPTNTRIYTVAVYFKGQRLAEAAGHSIQQAEMNAAKKALQRSHGLFPQLDHQKRVIAKSLKTQNGLRTEQNNYRAKFFSGNTFNRRPRRDFNYPLKRNKNDDCNERNYKRLMPVHETIT